MAMLLPDVIKNVFLNARTTVREINQKYAHPRIQITPMVRIALIALRVYLIVLVGILFYKFITVLKTR